MTAQRYVLWCELNRSILSPNKPECFQERQWNCETFTLASAKMQLRRCTIVRRVSLFQSF